MGLSGSGSSAKVAGTMASIGKTDFLESSVTEADELRNRHGMSVSF